MITAKKFLFLFISFTILVIFNIFCSLYILKTHQQKKQIENIFADISSQFQQSNLPLKNSQLVKEEITIADGRVANLKAFFRKDRELQIPAMLEMLQIPYTGSSPLTHGFALNKEKAKEIFIAKKIPTAPFQKIDSPDFILDKKLKFPLIIKPVSQGSSAGITNDSVVFNIKSLKRQVKKVIESFNQPALVEPFLEGREFSVAMLGNPPEILPIIEPNHSLLPKGYLPFDSFEVKWFFEEEENNNYLQCPAKIDKKLENKIKKICLDVWNVLDVLDWCRIDLKCDKNNNPYVLEINTPAGLIPPEVSMTSYFPLTARAAGIDYETLLLKIIQTAVKRYGINKFKI